MHIEEELAAVQVVLLTMISAMPDRKEFGKLLDEHIAELQTNAMLQARGRPMSPHLREALDRWRGQIAFIDGNG